MYPATTEIYTLSLHDALPISSSSREIYGMAASSMLARGHPRWASKKITRQAALVPPSSAPWHQRDRKSTRLNSSHANISYAVFCLKKKTKAQTTNCQLSDHDN